MLLTILRINNFQNNFRKSLKSSLEILYSASFLGLILNLSALASTFTTTLTFYTQTKYFPEDYKKEKPEYINGSLVFNWYGKDLDADGVIDESELTYLSVNFSYNMDSYQEVIVKNGIVPKANNIRSSQPYISSILWRYEVNNSRLVNFSTHRNNVIFNSENYHAFSGSDAFVFVVRRIDGVEYINSIGVAHIDQR